MSPYPRVSRIEIAPMKQCRSRIEAPSFVGEKASMAPQTRSEGTSCFLAAIYAGNDYAYRGWKVGKCKRVNAPSIKREWIETQE